MRQTPRENQQQRPEFRHEKGGYQQTMPVSFLLPLPRTGDLFKRKTSVVIRRLYMFHEGKTSVRVTLTFRFVENFVTVFSLLLLLLFHFLLLAPREIFRHEKNARSFLSLLALHINFKNVRECAPSWNSLRSLIALIVTSEKRDKEM